MDAWIDTYHAVKRLTSQGTFVFLTDSAVGAAEEDNLRHLVTNLGHDVPRQRIVPFLTTKHPLDYCLSYAERAHQSGFPALVVLGGDKSVGAPRSVEHAWKLRQLLRERDHTLTLGGWANPHADPERQVDFLTAPNFHGEFYLTQIVSHHDAGSVDGSSSGPPEAAGASGSVRGVLLPERQPANAGVAQGFPARAGRRADARVRRGATAPRKSAPEPSARSSTPARDTSTSATCLSAQRPRCWLPS